jgi:hypothetical protein
VKRLLALVVALALVGGALYLRSERDDKGGDDAGGAGGNEQPAGPTRLVCASELGAICRDVAGEDVTVTIEDSNTTFDRLITKAEPDLDAWLAFDPWPEMVDAERERVTLEPLFVDRTVRLARSRLAALGPADLGPCGWRCLGDRSIAEELRLGLPELNGGLGLLIVGAATAGYFARADIATNDFDQPFEDWLSSLLALARVERSPVLSILQSRAFLDVALSVESDAKPRFDTAAPDRKAGLALLYPDPVASVDAVLAGSPGGLNGDLTGRLLEAGWSAPDAAPSGLPNAGVLLALRERLQ